MVEFSHIKKKLRTNIFFKIALNKRRYCTFRMIIINRNYGLVLNVEVHFIKIISKSVLVQF